MQLDGAAIGRAQLRIAGGMSDGDREHGHQTEPATAAERRFRLVVEAAPSAMVMG